MRIESTDASRMTYSGSTQQNTNTEALKVEKVEVSKAEIKNSEAKDNKNTQRMTDLERNFLPISEKVVIDAIERANKAISGANTSFEFSIHEKTHEIMVKVIDKDTKEIIREIPPEKVLDMVAKMWEMAGLFVDERR